MKRREYHVLKLIVEIIISTTRNQRRHKMNHDIYLVTNQNLFNLVDIT